MLVLVVVVAAATRLAPSLVQHAGLGCTAGAAWCQAAEFLLAVAACGQRRSRQLAGTTHTYIVQGGCVEVCVGSIKRAPARTGQRLVQRQFWFDG